MTNTGVASRRAIDSSGRRGGVAALAAFGSASDMRDALRRQRPAFAPSALKALAIVGAAGEGLRLAELCMALGIAVRAVVDDDPKKRGMRVGSASVAPVESLATIDKSVPVVVASHRVLKAQDRIQAMGFKDVAPFALLQVLDPARFPPHMFYDGWLEDLAGNRGEYDALADLLADDFSRRVLDAVVDFRLTLDAAALRPIVEWDLYGPASLLSYGDDEVYVDGGSFDGDTIRLFIDRVHGRYARVIAFEPDKNTFTRLAANFIGEPRIEPINAGLHARTATLHFDNAGTRGSILVESGGIEVPVVGLDEVLKGDRVTYIKMNIEGAELDALRGAAKAIARWSPKLAISAYHRPSDLWRVPQQIREINPRYRLYLRQHDGGVIETVCYGLA